MKEKKEKTVSKYHFYNPKTKKIEIREKKIKIKSGKEGFTLKKGVIFISFILLELIAFSILLTRFIIYFDHYLIISLILSIICVVRVVVNNKNTDSKIAWIIFLFLFFPIGFLVYIFIGELNCHPLTLRRIKKINAKHILKEEDIPQELSPRILNDYLFLKNTSTYIPSYNSDAVYFPTGELYFNDVLENLKLAKEFIFLEYFIFDDGILTKEIIDILKEKAKDGVDVRIIIDGLGSQNMISYKTYKMIKSCGIKINVFGPILPFLNIFMNYRDHRKIVVIDKNIAYLGGTNAADEYINQKERFGYWKDEGIKIAGKAVNNVIVMFLRMWELLERNYNEDYEKFLNDNKEDMTESSKIVIPFGDGPSEKFPIGKGIYSNIINSTKNYLYIMTPYLIIENMLMEIIKNKALSGVDVRIIIPYIPDKKFVYRLTRDNAERLSSYGVKIYLYKPGFIHSKVILSDDECAVVGSINMDFRSFYQQYESGVYLTNSDTLLSIKDDFNKTFEESIILVNNKKKNIFYRMLLSVLRIFAPIM